MSMPGTDLSVAQQMLSDGSLPDMPASPGQNAAPMRAVVAAASTTNPDALAKKQQLAQQAGMPVDLTQSNPEAARQRAVAADLDRRQLEVTNPILASQLRDPNFAGVAHDDLDSLSQIEQGAAQLRASTENASRLAGLTPTERQAVIADRVRVAMNPAENGGGAGWFNRLQAEGKSLAANIDLAGFNAVKPFVDAAGALVQGAGESLVPATDALTGGDAGVEQLKHIWTDPRTAWIQKQTGALQDYFSARVLHGPQQQLIDPATQQPFVNPDYHWYARSLLNSTEQVPGVLAAFALTGKVAGAGAEAAGVDAAAAPATGMAGAAAPISASAEREIIPGLIGTQAAQNTYAEARAKGADQKQAIAAALAAGVSNYMLMGKMPEAAPSESVPGAIGQWAARSAGMGTALTLTDNTVARGYDPNRGLFEGLPQSIASMAAYEGVGAIGRITDAVAASKLRTRSPEAFQQSMNENFAGDESLRVPAQDFVNYFQDKKLDPAAMASGLGVTNLDEAAAAGSDLEIPKASFFGKLDPEHQKGLQPDIVDPVTGITMRQAQGGREELQQWQAGGGIEKLQAEYAQADAETQATPEWKSVYSELKQRYVDAGEEEPAADSYATLHANAIANLARNAGLKPDELLAMHNPNIVAGEAPGAVLHQGPQDAEPAANAAPAHQDRLLVHNNWGETGREFTATMGAEPLKPGDIIAENKDGVALKVMGLEGKSSRGSQWYKFQTVDADAARAAGETVTPNVKGRPASEYARGASEGAQNESQEKPPIIDDAQLRAVAPKPVLDKLEQSREAIASFATRPDEWNLLPGIRAAVARLGSVEHDGEPANPVVDALAHALDGDPKAAKKAFAQYAEDAALNKSERSSTTNDAFDAFNRAFGSKLTPEEFHDGLEKAAQAENTAGDADLSGAAAGAEGAGRGEPDGAARPGAAGDAGRPASVQRSAGGDESGHGGAVERAASGAGVEPGTGDGRDAGDGVTGKRGWFRILPDGRYEIGKTSIGDFSTFVHEPAHAYLEMFRELTQREGASEPLKADFNKICDWLGTTPEDAYRDGFTREQHEKWADANEQYARDGKAPSDGLRRAFHNFSVWLSSIYRRANGLGVELSSSVRGVMDRLYAGEDAVNRAGHEQGEKLFGKPEDAGWTDAEYRNYADSKGLEADKAREQVHAELNDAAVRERTDQWREEKGNVRDAVTAEIDKRPEYAAIRSLRRGKTDLGTDLTLNRDELVKQFGEERVLALQKLHRGLYRQEGGTDAETASELLGYRSGEEMMRSMENAPRRAAAIEQGTRDTMTAKHGDIRYDGSLPDKARLAMENDERAKNLHSELAALRLKMAGLEKKAADAKAAMRAITVEPLSHYQEAARQMIDQKAIADLQPYRYLNASRKFSREAFDALRSGDVRKAADAKNKELLNHFLFREASAGREYADKFESYTKRMQSKGIQQRLGLAGSDYREQFNWLLARYRLGPAPAGMPDRSLRAWADEVYGQGNEPAIDPGILDSNKHADYRSVPLSEVRDLHDALVNVRHLAMQQFKMFVQGKQIDFAEAKQGMIESARENLRVKPEKTFDENRSATDKMAGGPEWADARLIRMERLIEWLDGGKAGPWHENLWNPAADSQGDEDDLQQTVTERVLDGLNDMSPEMRKSLWTDKVSVEGVGEPLTRRRMLSMAFNMGNEGNLDRLRKTFIDKGWDPGAIEKIGGMLTRDEWQFVQKTWDSLKPLGVRMQELEKRLTGLPPAMVKVTPLKIALDHGEEINLAGGYFPIVMDPKYSQRAIEQDSRETAQNAMQSGYVRATTAKGYTKERTGFGGPLLLDYEQALTSHVAKVTKDLSHREFMLSSQRLLLDTEVRKTLRETLGPAYEQQFMPWLRTIINDNNGSVQERLDGVKDAMQKLRGNFVTAALSFNPATSLLQISHAPRMLLYARPASLAQSLVDFLARPVESTQEIRELSPNEMRFRGENLDRDLRAVLQKPEYSGGYTRKVAVAGRFALQLTDHLFSHTLWRAAYNDALGKYADQAPAEAQKNAVYEADSAVRLGLGASAPKDLPAIMRGNEFNKFITALYGFHSGVYNQLRDIGHQFRYDRNLGKLTYAGILTAVLPAVLGSWLTGNGPKNDENKGAWAAKRSLLFSADTIPILRAGAAAIDGGRDVQFSPIEAVMTKGVKDTAEAFSDKDDKDWLGIGLDAGEAAGETFGVPGSHQAAKTLKYIHRANEGKIEDPNLWGAVVGGR